MRIEFAGDIVTQPLAKLVRQLPAEPATVMHHGIDQHMQALLAGTEADIFICHCLTETFLNDRQYDIAAQRMTEYCAALEALAATGRTLVIANLLAPPAYRLFGTDHLDTLRCVAGLNDMLMRVAERQSFVSLADLPAVVTRLGHERAISPSNALVMRMPYTGQALNEVINEYVRCILERRVARKKVILLDADNTLWGGVVGEDGVEGLKVDDQFPGKVHLDFQKLLLNLRDSGIVLALVTKNNEADVREAFDTLNMPLKWDDFTAIRANWQPKSENIQSIAAQLNLGSDSMLFIDDNPFEIEEVQSALPGVATLQFDPQAAAEPLRWLSRASGLSAWSTTAEDRQKAEQYRQEGARAQLAEKAASLEDYIASLGIVIEVGLNRKNHVQRIAQLTNKTNQFNLTTRRYSETAIIDAMASGHVFDFRVTDRFGDMGIVGVVIVRNSEIEVFLMSCRALGRRIESDILAYVLNNVPARPLFAKFLPTSKNAMVRTFYDDNHFTLVGEDDHGRTYRYDEFRPIALTNTMIASE